MLTDAARSIAAQLFSLRSLIICNHRRDHTLFWSFRATCSSSFDPLPLPICFTAGTGSIRAAEAAMPLPPLRAPRARRRAIPFTTRRCSGRSSSNRSRKRHRRRTPATTPRRERHYRRRCPWRRPPPPRPRPPFPPPHRSTTGGRRGAGA